MLEVNGPAIARRAAFRKTLTDIIVRDDRRLFLKELVPAGVIFVVMRIDHEAHGPIGDALQSCLNLIG